MKLFSCVGMLEFKHLFIAIQKILSSAMPFAYIWWFMRKDCVKIIKSIPTTVSFFTDALIKIQ